MFKKLNSIKLLVILAVLCGVYFIVEYTGGKKKSKSLRTELVQMDTSKVTRLKVEMKGEVIDLTKENNIWILALESGKSVKASQSSVEAALGALLTVKPSRMATRKESKWSDYEVDSTGTRVTVFSGKDKALDIILGKFGVEGRNSYHTFVRLVEDKEVYAAKNFMNFSVPTDAASYRNQELLKINSDSLIAITFNYPGDSSVQLSNNGGVWASNGQSADSTAVATYISSLKNITSKNFEDDNGGLTIPVFTARYTFSNQEDVIVEAYEKDESWIMHSSQNDQGYFNDPEVLKKIFKGQSTF